MFLGLKVITTLSYVTMVVVNALANALPINGVGTGDVSDSYPDLFAPAGLTFAIWGLIYLMLGAYIVYQLGFLGTSRKLYERPAWRKVAVLFTISSFANALWVFAWHYDFIGVSLGLMVVILACLIAIMENLRSEDTWLKLPFSVYFGWITVATIANVTTWLVSIGWQGLGISEAAWTVIVLVVGLLISIATMISHRDSPYGLVIIWAYAGIAIKHMAAGGFAWAYPSIITTVAISILVLIGAQAYLYRLRGSRRGSDSVISSL